MIPLREKIPMRRTIPSLNPGENKWRKHKPDLREDFNNHCGYCHSYDGFKHTYFEVDHFVPKSKILLYRWNISLTEYSNLVYSCKFCNNKKLNNWPIKSATIYNDGIVGFVDPCDPNFDSHFYRNGFGAIRAQTTLGKWMFREAFKFDERERSIIVLFNMNRLRQIIDALIIQLDVHLHLENEHNLIRLKLGEYALQYYIFHKELIEFYEQ
jgi:mRNA-degrading endonuclease RelE of RelBE toxin-antitoxin system